MVKVKRDISMKKKLILIIIIVTIVFIKLPIHTYAVEITGTYISQVDGTEYVFYSDGILYRNGEKGSYYLSDDAITMIISGYAEKYTYEFLDDLLIIYDLAGKGIALSKQEEGLAENTIVEPEEIDMGFTTQEKIDFEKLAKSVLLLYCYDKNDELVATASGFIAFDGRTIVTNYHVIEDIVKIIAQNEYGKEIEITNVTHYDVERDVAILIVEDDTGLDPLKIGNSSLAKKGDTIYTIGSPQGLINTVSSGMLSGEILLEDQTYLQISAPTSSGSSGGVLLNEDGQVIGVTSAGYNEGQNLNFAIPINDVVELNKQPENRMTLRNCAIKENPDFLLEPQSVYTGKIIKTNNRLATRYLTVDTFGDCIFYVYLKNILTTPTFNLDYSFIVLGGDSFQMRIAPGYYKVYYCCGSLFYGEKYKVGANGSYYTVNDRLEIIEKTYTEKEERLAEDFLGAPVEDAIKDGYLALNQFPKSGCGVIFQQSFPE